MTSNSSFAEGSTAPTPYDQLAHYYELEYRDYTHDIDFYIQLLRRTGGPFLDLGTGTGRVALGVSRAGYEAVGMDVSRPMLAIAQAKAGREVDLIEGDMRCFEMDRQFSLIAPTLNAFMHVVQTEDQVSALRCMARHLAPQGRIVVSTINPYNASLQDLEAKVIHEFSKRDPETGAMVSKLSSREVDTAAQIEYVTYFYDEVKDGQLRRTISELQFRYTYRYELELLLRQAGLRTSAVYGTYELDPYDLTSPNLIIVAQAQSE